MNQTYNVRLSNNSPRDSDDDFEVEKIKPAENNE